MPDVYHDFGGDLVVSANGDLLLSDGVKLSQQTVLRRLLTNAGDYLWHADYGAGLPAMVGKSISVAAVSSLITSQMFLEQSVQKNPAPVITVAPIPNGMFAAIKYTETDSGQTGNLSFSVNG